ncbi:MAG: Rne/Rng family ribonuclease [Thermodesulfobacteriota bacterium]|nr:Rne/Rng family ribonuclease [Thermodesulfobacteriota bacterium]
MTDKILINAVDTEECRIARVKDNRLCEFHLETTSRVTTKSNIYKGLVVRVEPSLQAVFVDYGEERHGFLQKHDIHTDYFQDSKADGSIRDLIKPGQEMLVQVVKDPIMHKGAALTTFLSIPGRFCVLMPGSVTKGVSKQIEDEEERKRLKEIVNGLRVPENFGVILRTAAKGAAKTVIAKDLSYLMRLWKTIKKEGMNQKAPAALHKERDFAVRAIRDYLTADIQEILIDEPSVHQEVKDFVALVSPRHAKIVRLYQGAKPIFTKHELESQIESIFENRVQLPSGGSIVLTQTEALVSIDVNSGKSRQKHSIEETALQTNLEAAEEIARQLRLRDMGGLIVIDFIDMKPRKNNAAVERALKTHLKEDKARTDVGKISKFGLLEMSRQRLRQSIETSSMVTCSHCGGRGYVMATEKLGINVLRRLRLESLKHRGVAVTATVPAVVADYLLNKKRSELLELEARRDLAITITGDPAMRPGESDIRFEGKPNGSADGETDAS